MDLLALPIGSIIVACCMTSPPPGWRDITGTFECVEQIDYFEKHVPAAGEFIARDKLFCIKKITEEGTS